MSKELLTDLDRDVERLLFAGAEMARSDGDLLAKRDRMALFAEKAPALSKIVEQIEKVHKAEGDVRGAGAKTTKGSLAKATAAELLNLSAMMAQVRGAQASPAVPTGELLALPPAEPIESELSSAEVTSLFNAFTNAPDARHRPRILKDAIERGAVRDIRLVPYYVKALADPALGSMIETDVLPALGPVVLPELLSSLDLGGKALEARKLRAIVKIQQGAATPLLLEATEKGSPEIRATAIRELAEIDPRATEPVALRLVATDRSADVRKAAVEALGSGTTDAALDALLEALAEGDLRRTAVFSLVRLAHPKTTERILALLSPELLALTPLRTVKDDPRAKRAEKDHQGKVTLLSGVVDVLAGRKDRDTSATVLEIFRHHKIKEIQRSAARALLKSGYEGAFDELAPSVYEADWETQHDFIESVTVRDPARAFDKLARFFAPSSTKNKIEFAITILNHIESAAEEPVDEESAAAAEDAEAKSPNAVLADPRWIDLAIKLLERPELCAAALSVLASVRSPKALDAVLRFTGSRHFNNGHAWRVLRVLTAYRDPRIVPVLLKLLEAVKTGYWSRRTIYNAIRLYDDPSIAPSLRTWAEKKRFDKREKEDFESLLAYLERDRTLT